MTLTDPAHSNPAGSIGTNTGYDCLYRHDRSLPKETLISAGVWMVPGLLVYFGYSKANSKLK